MRRARFAWLSVLPFLASAAHGQAEEIALGALTLAYDAAVWRAEPVLEESLWRLDCVTGDCRGLSPTALPYVYVLVRPASPAGPATCVRTDAPLPGNAPSPFSYARENHGGVAFDVTTTNASCRSENPYLLEACGAHGASEYLITTGFTFGTNCGPVPKLPVARFRELLEGLAPAGPAP
jgi:hypothetical protein